MPSISTRLPIEDVPIATIQVGLRRRTKLGSLTRLRQSIALYGLLHPILLGDGNDLVCGYRRLEACRALGWTKIPARRVDTLTEAEFRAIELDENVERRDLDSYEASAARLAEIRQAQAQTRAISSQPGTKQPRPHRATGRAKGRPKEAGSKREVQAQTGISKPEQARVEEHVALAERFPFLQRAGWVRHRVLEIGSLLEQLPHREHAKVATLLDQDGVPPVKAIALVKNLGRFSPATRAAIYTAATDPDVHVRQNALAQAAELPPMPDPALVHLTEARSRLRRAGQVCRVVPLQDAIRVEFNAVDGLVQRLQIETGGHRV